MKRIQEVIVVEGKTDTATLQQLFDVDTIETSGSGINEAILQQIETAAKTRGVIILTDPDYPGQQIRNRIIARVPNAKHAFVPVEDATDNDDIGIERLYVGQGCLDIIIDMEVIDLTQVGIHEL